MPAKNPKILLIEDDVMLASFYKNLLEENGMKVTVIGDGDIALEEAKKDGYDLILLDIMLPKVDGLEIIETLHKRKKTEEIPVIIISNLDQKSLIKKGLDSGASGYLVKATTSPEQVLAQVKAHIYQEKS